MRKKEVMSAEHELIGEHRKPSFFWLATEINRALFELGTFYPYNALSRCSDEGDGHPVLVLPGFMATDISTKPLRTHLEKCGYSGYGWGLGRNYASTDYLDELVNLCESLYRSHKQKVSVIGWSLGGIFARQVAKELPHIIRQVITLGSPFGDIQRPNNAVWLYNILTNGKGTETVDQELIADIPRPAPVPSTAIYSKEDGVVPWQACMESINSDIHQNIQVRGSHLGLGVNPVVLKIVIDRLQYREENWSKWEPSGIFEDLLSDHRAVRA
ncbi:MAG: alpha/beta hydrolase [Bacteroidota bacterium]